MLYDRQLIDDELYQLWSAFTAKVRIVMLSDSCHSGTVAKPMAGRPRSANVPMSRRMPLDVEDSDLPRAQAPVRRHPEEDAGACRHLHPQHGGAHLRMPGQPDQRRRSGSTAGSPDGFSGLGQGHLQGQPGEAVQGHRGRHAARPDAELLRRRGHQPGLPSPARPSGCSRWRRPSGRYDSSWACSARPVAGSAGKNDSMASSARVMSTAVPNVANVLKK